MFMYEASLRNSRLLSASILEQSLQLMQIAVLDCVFKSVQIVSAMSRKFLSIIIVQLRNLNNRVYKKKNKLTTKKKQMKKYSIQFSYLSKQKCFVNDQVPLFILLISLLMHALKLRKRIQSCGNMMAIVSFNFCKTGLLSQIISSLLLLNRSVEAKAAAANMNAINNVN